MAKFEAGNAGRKPGTKNKNTLRERISAFLEREFDGLENSFAGLKANQRIEVYLKLLPYAVGPLKAVESGSTLEDKLNQLNLEQLENIVDQILEENEGI